MRKDVKNLWLYYKVVIFKLPLYMLYNLYENISLHFISSVEHLFVYIKSRESELKKIFRKII